MLFFHFCLIDESIIILSGSSTIRGPRFNANRGSYRPQTGPRVGMEAIMAANSNSQETQALIWTGSILGAIVVLGLIAYFAGVFGS